MIAFATPVPEKCQVPTNKCQVSSAISDHKFKMVKPNSSSTAKLVCGTFMLISMLNNWVESRHLRHSNHSNSNHSEVLLARELSARLMELSHWNCSEPKPRLVYIHEEHPHRIAANSRWLPPVAILHRCEHHTGCCLNHPADRCTSIKTEPVNILFKHYNVLTNAQNYERLTFTNHTQCGCVSEVDEPTISTSTPLPTSTTTSNLTTTFNSTATSVTTTTTTTTMEPDPSFSSIPGSGSSSLAPEVTAETIDIS